MTSSCIEQKDPHKLHIPSNLTQKSLIMSITSVNISFQKGVPFSRHEFLNSKVYNTVPVHFKQIQAVKM